MSYSRNDGPKGGRKNIKKEYSRILAIILLVFVVMITGAGLGFLTASLNTKPGLTNDIRPPASSQIYDINGHLITTVHSVENRVPVTLNKVPKNLQNAFISAEDTRFYQHMGIDPRGILRAAWSNISNRGVSEGGSTITQQLAKNAYLSQERTLKRKIQEAFLALQIERQYTKNEILELYLNQIYFGQGAYGVQAAAHLYFGKNVEDLNLAECAMLAGIPKSPNYYSPFNNLKAATERQAIVLDQMTKYGYIDHATARKAKSTKLDLSSHRTAINEGGIASYFVNYVTQLLIDKYGADAVYKDGLKVYTSLDLNMQRAAEKAMTKLPTYRTDDHGVKQPQGALVAIDPRTGHIKAMVGGRGNDQFNRAVMAERQPGSAFKPFVYLAAIESGLTPSTVIEDSKVTFGDWSPINYDGKLHGRVTMRAALERSLNIPTVKLAQEVGPDRPLYYAQQMGISTLVMQGYTNDRNLAMSLGGLTKGVTPLETASAYGVFANHGVRVDPVAILKIVDRNGKTLEQASPREQAVISERSAYIITDMLRGVITKGTGTAANIGRPAAGKTGTTSDYKDAWFVGYTPDLVAAVWMGNDNEGYLNGITGGTTPAVIWQAFMTDALADIPQRDFIKPAGLVIEPPPAEDPDKEETDPKDGEDKDKDSAKDKKDTGKNKNKPDSATAGQEQKTSSDKSLAPPKPQKPQTAPAAPPPPQSGSEEKNNSQ
ncbi:PBP1A family penicillin-binding protein|uniref:Penicillin-binding protein 1A n=1 Tax=Dendrosporobacter quercicolus TaxID=146817 RepID=A0A1G9KLQ4_9FIRM|nr:penicillin-binding protein 1A [Dendrosporobacter quercicolus]NSL46444.1 PBP1A family penicillin-binding protein [Dendrosporobacter quercicolus DSM 1736]SDL50602.1 penicillin-binding protein 1A [Dendrosporobacter quercicolus]